MTNQQYFGLLGLCLLILFLVLCILLYLLKSYCPKIPKPTISMQKVNVTLAHPTEEEFCNSVFITTNLDNDGYYSESALQDSFFQATDTSGQATTSTEENQ